MRTHKWGLVLVLGIIAAVFSACNFNLTTANIRSLKISKDEDGKNEASTFGPGEKVYVVADIANNVGKVQVKFRVLYDDVEGKDTGTAVGGAEKTLDVEGSRPAIFWITLPRSDFANGRYRAEVTMYAENGQQKGQQTATFKVEGFTADKATKSDDGDNSAETSEKNGDSAEKTSGPQTSENTEKVSGPPAGSDGFGNGSFRGSCRNKISGQRASLSFELTRTGNDISGSAFVGPPLRGSGVVTGQVNGDRIELWLQTKDVRQKWTIHINGDRTAGGGFAGSYTISDGQYGVFSVVKE